MKIWKSKGGECVRAQRPARGGPGAELEKADKKSIGRSAGIGNEKADRVLIDNRFPLSELENEDKRSIDYRALGRPPRGGDGRARRQGPPPWNGRGWPRIAWRRRTYPESPEATDGLYGRSGGLQRAFSFLAADFPLPRDGKTSPPSGPPPPGMAEDGPESHGDARLVAFLYPVQRCRDDRPSSS